MRHKWLVLYWSDTHKAWDSTGDELLNREQAEEVAKDWRYCEHIVRVVPLTLPPRPTKGRKKHRFSVEPCDLCKCQSCDGHLTVYYLAHRDQCHMHCHYKFATTKDEKPK